MNTRKVGGIHLSWCVKWIDMDLKEPRAQSWLPLAPYSQIWKLWGAGVTNMRILRQFWCGAQVSQHCLGADGEWKRSSNSRSTDMEQMADVTEVILTHSCLLSFKDTPLPPTHSLSFPPGVSPSINFQLLISALQAVTSSQPSNLL